MNSAGLLPNKTIIEDHKSGSNETCPRGTLNKDQETSKNTQLIESRLARFDHTLIFIMRATKAIVVLCETSLKQLRRKEIEEEKCRCFRLVKTRI